MRPEYNGIKFYNEYDWSLGDNLKASKQIPDAFNPQETYNEIIDVPI